MRGKKAKAVRRLFLKHLESGLAQALPKGRSVLASGQLVNPRQMAYRLLKREAR